MKWLFCQILDNIQSVAFSLTFDTDVFGLWCLTPLSTIFQLYRISVISWQSVLLVDATGVPGENHRPVASHWQTSPHNVSYYHTTTRAPASYVLHLMELVSHIWNRRRHPFQIKWLPNCLVNISGPSWCLTCALSISHLMFIFWHIFCHAYVLAKSLLPLLLYFFY